MEHFNSYSLHKSRPANKQHTYLSIYILHHEGRGQVNTIVMEHFNSILLHKSRPANKQHTYLAIRYNTRELMGSKGRIKMNSITFDIKRLYYEISL